ncbi:MAG: hypothetical protein HOP29_04320 [Phycisphaerales bacterium]|nr:hypothetical protein [Phycisphaerales bacterium]
MARPKPVVPGYRRQRKRGGVDLAFVEVGGRRVYLGPWGSSESRQNYARVTADWKSGATTRAVANADPTLTVIELCAAHDRVLDGNYRQPGGGCRTKRACIAG